MLLFPAECILWKQLAVHPDTQTSGPLRDYLISSTICDTLEAVAEASEPA